MIWKMSSEKTPDPQLRQFWVKHTSLFRYGAALQHSVMSLRLKPRSDLQEFWNFDIQLEPDSCLVEFTDWFGNAGHLVTTIRNHKKLVISTSMYAETRTVVSHPPQLMSSDWDAIEKMAPVVQYWNFLKPSHFVQESPLLLEFMADKGIERGSDPLTSLLHAASQIFRSFRYSPHNTNVDSQIDSLIETGGGVCQDYTHLLLAISRHFGIPARYVSGYYYVEPTAGQPEPIGATHAWAECLLPKIGWLGIDPTNDDLANHRHIRIGIGRDYADIPPTKGVIFGGGSSEVEVRVKVVEVTDT